MTPDEGLPASGVELLARGRFQEALEPLHRAIALGDRTPATMLNLAIALERGAGAGKGLRHAQSVAVRVPDWDEPWLRLAEHLRATGETLAAEDAYHHVLALNPDRPEALIAVGGLMLMRGSAKQACDVLAHGCGVASDNAEAWNTLGLALQASGAPHLALAAFTTAQRLQPDRFEYLLNGANLAGAAGAGDTERNRFLSACRQNPLSPSILLAYGMLLDRLGHRP
jgi:protein O-GlcNAc transferase